LINLKESSGRKRIRNKKRKGEKEGGRAIKGWIASSITSILEITPTIDYFNQEVTG